VAAERVRVVMKELRSERDRQILARHYLHDKDQAAICRELGISETTFNVILFRAAGASLKSVPSAVSAASLLFSEVAGTDGQRRAAFPNPPARPPLPILHFLSCLDGDV